MHIPRGMYGEPQLDLEGREVPPREPGWLAPRLLRSSLPKVQTKIMLYYTNLGDSNVYGEQITKETFADIRYRLHTRAIPYPGRDLWVYWMERNENSESVVGVPRQVVSRIPIPCLFAMRPGSMEAESSRTAAARQQQYQAGVLHAGMSRSSAPTAGPSRLSVTSFPGISQEVEGAAQEEAAQEEVPTNPDRSISASNSGLPREPPTIPPPSSAPRVDSATENGTPSNERGSNAPGKRRAYQ
ncbi:hypothetical protein BDV97DRAFT_346237 [Delphinella strobiligena]|nr:hypothetical protein BDV97DRAFT_346237 [Delphinella strobiligena]